MGEKRKRSKSLSEAESAFVLIEALERESKKVRTEPETEGSTTPRPLTEENLRLLQGLPAMPSKRSKLSDDMTETSSSTTSVHTQKLLQINNIRMEDNEAVAKCPQIRDRAKAIISQNRDTAMPEENKNRILSKKKCFPLVNEDTFIDLLWPVLIQNKRHKKGSGTDEGVEEGTEILLTAWDADHLSRNRNKNLRFTLHRIAIPKSDYYYGLLKEAFTPAEQKLNDTYRYFTFLSDPLYHCFFAVEFKTEEGDFRLLRTQCCRAGAAMVHGTENLTKLITPIGRHPFTDDHLRNTPCMAFSLAVAPATSELNVHWAEPLGNTTVYHMHRIKKYWMDEGDALENLRNYVENIVDWGDLARKIRIQEVLARIQAENDRRAATTIAAAIPTRSKASLKTPSKGGKKRVVDNDWEEVNQADEASGGWAVGFGGNDVLLHTASGGNSAQRPETWMILKGAKP